MSITNDFLYTEIITGEKIQFLSDIFLGLKEDFDWNPLVKIQKDKHQDLNNINDIYDNPKIIFCYSHRINLFVEKIKYFKNDFILISHNSDYNIIEDNITHKILNDSKLIKWYAQNSLVSENLKIDYLPIGLANSQWNHGNLNFYKNFDFKNLNLTKNKNVFFNFNIQTNISKRKECYEILKNKIEFLPNIDIMSNIKRMSEYRFCICPEGNGIDTHRFWEALYLSCIPIVLKNPLIMIIKERENLPMIILNSWDELDVSKLNYNLYTFDENYFNKLSFNNLKRKILSHIPMN
jgi:hypothetical protein